jgi:16S rRNA processing protein RimM
VSLPFQAWEGLPLWVVPPDHDLIRKTRVLTATENEKGLVLTLEGVTDRTTAQRLVGRFLLASTDDCDVEDANRDASSFVGKEVVDEVRGLIGTVVEERRGTAQTLLVVEGPFGEVLIPQVDEFIRSDDGHMLGVRLPEGLLELST